MDFAAWRLLSCTSKATHMIIELQLAHAPRNAVSAAYNHALYVEPRAKMMQGWADYIERTQRGAMVLNLPGSAA
jgi:hypothetical protein